MMVDDLEYPEYPDHPDIPTPGFYLWKPWLGKTERGKNIFGQTVPVYVRSSITPDPNFPNNEQDRSEVLSMFVCGQEIQEPSWNIYWPWCAKNKVTKEEHDKEMEKWL